MKKKILLNLFLTDCTANVLYCLWMKFNRNIPTLFLFHPRHVQYSRDTNWKMS